VFRKYICDGPQTKARALQHYFAGTMERQRRAGRLDRFVMLPLTWTVY